MRRSVNQVTLINVIRPDATHQQLLPKCPHRLDIVIYTGEENALIPQRNSVIGQAFKCLFHFDRQLSRMIYMHTHPQWMKTLQHGAKIRRNALREENRNAGANSQKLNMPDCSQTREYSLELLVAKNESVAT